MSRWLYLFVTVLIVDNNIQSQTYQSLMTFLEPGTEFIPANPIEFIATYTDLSTIRLCFNRCHMNIRCRTFVSDSTLPFVCQLYEGTIDSGTVINSSSPTSQVGGIHYYASHYIYYNQICNSNLPPFDRYLVCINGSWHCPTATFWNGSLCLNNVYNDDTCYTDDVCLQDIGLHCSLTSNKCMCNSTAAWNGTFCESCVVAYGQCGGFGWTGLTKCCTSLTCTYTNNSFSQCLTISNASTYSISIESLTTMSYVNETLQNSTTLRYWDCCKASCGWPGKAIFTSPVKTCELDGITPIDNNTQSACATGTAYMCTNQQPWNVSNTLSYGYASAHITGQGESDWCCACYSLVFTSGLVIGKELIVQVTNTNYNSGNSFGLQIPGGGWGGSPNGCASQFNSSSYSWGQPYGGVSSRSDCANLPNSLQSGCYWRFDWFMDANNPSVLFKEVPCPIVLPGITLCQRI